MLRSPLQRHISGAGDVDIYAEGPTSDDSIELMSVESDSDRTGEVPPDQQPTTARASEEPEDPFDEHAIESDHSDEHGIQHDNVEEHVVEEAAVVVPEIPPEIPRVDVYQVDYSQHRGPPPTNPLLNVL